MNEFLTLVSVLGGMGCLCVLPIALIESKYFFASCLFVVGCLCVVGLFTFGGANTKEKNQLEQTRLERVERICRDRYHGTVGTEKVGGYRYHDVYEEFCYGVNTKLPTSAL